MNTLLEAQLKVNVLKWTEKLCRALEQDYRNYALRTCMDNQEKVSSEYMQERIREIENDDRSMKFFIEKGRKYYKVCMLWRGTQDDVSVHCFVDKKTGEVYKASSWKAPAKGVRFDMRIMSHRAMMHDYKQVDWAGGHLYYR